MTDRLWWWALVALAVLVGGFIVHGQPRTVTLAIGRFDATEQERQECVFSLGLGAALMLHPDGEPCKRARELVGTTGALVWERD